MSIAVSVIVRPSSCLRWSHAGLCCCVMASAAFCPGVVAPLLCLLMGARGWLVGRSAAIARQLDISGVGLVRLAVYQHNGVPQRVLAGSTFWPRLLVLRLDPRGYAKVMRLPAPAAMGSSTAQRNTPA